MSYTPTDWKTGDLITAEKLNNMESGIAGGGAGLFVINATGIADENNVQTQPTIDKTWDEIVAAVESGLIPVISASRTVSGASAYTYLFPVGYAKSDGAGGCSFLYSEGNATGTGWDVTTISVIIMLLGTMSTYQKVSLALNSN